MKKVLVAVLGLALAGSAVGEINNPFDNKDWMEISKKNSEIIYANTDNIIIKKYNRETLAGIWFGSLYTIPNIDKDLSPRPVKYLKAMVWEDCKNRTRSEPVEFVFFDENGASINSGESVPVERADFSNIVPNSVESNIHDVACFMALAKELDEAQSDTAREFIFKQYPFQAKIIAENHKQ